jgi:hypothetical protein
MTTARTQYEDKKGKVVGHLANPDAPTSSAMARLRAKRLARKRRLAEYEEKRKAAEAIVEKLKRVVAVCPGLPAKGKHAEVPCGKRVLVTLGQGRPWTRCGECRVMMAWRQHFLREDPASVVKVIERLAAKGRIGQGPRVG